MPDQSEHGSYRRHLQAVRRRYNLAALFYDTMPLLKVAFARARARAVQLLQLQPGSSVLDIACGTGLNLPLIQDCLAGSGRIIAIDYSPGMLKAARSKAARRGWSNMHFIEADAARLSAEMLFEAAALEPPPHVDAAICTLGLSVIPEWEKAYTAMLDMVKPGGRVAIMDAGYPRRPGTAGEVIALRPLWWIADRVARADSHRRPWLRLPRDVDGAVTEYFGGGYVGVSAGTVPHATSTE